MRFNDEERAILLAIKGVGPKVVERIESLGVTSLSDLAAHDPAKLCDAVAAKLGAFCWKNSPQARTAIASAVEAARGIARSRGHAGTPPPLQ